MSALVRVNLTGTVEQASVGADPYRIDHDGAPYVPVGDGGIVLGLRLGDAALSPATDHAAPGACLTHPDPAAGYALSAQACIGNQVEVRTGAAAGALGAVAGKRGEGGRVIAVFAQAVLRRLRPGDQVAVRTCGQGAPGPLPEVTLRNADPRLLDVLPVAVTGETLATGVRSVWPSRVVGNGIGRPTPLWDLDLQVGGSPLAAGLQLGDVVAIKDLDARYNAGFRRGWTSVGVVVHGGSPQPGHGPGVTVILTGPSTSFSLEVQPEGHRGLSEAALLGMASAHG